LNLVAAVITPWNTVYLAAVDALRLHGTVDEALLPHLLQLGGKHITLAVDYA
jgi:hypothetical protein